MRYEEWMNVLKHKPELIRTGDDKNQDYKEHDDICIVKGFIPIKVDAVSSSFLPPVGTPLETVNGIDIKDEGGNQLGTLIPCANLEIIDPFQISDANYAAYINDIDVSLYGTKPYRFKHHYAIIDFSQYENYRLNYAETSFLWGGYFHDFTANILIDTHKSIPSFITAVANLQVPHQDHIVKGSRALLQSYSYERFLNQYHLLEMLFTYQLVENIRSANDVLEGINLINLYRSKKFKSERDFLEEVVGSRCDRIIDLITHFAKIGTDPYYIQKAEEIFVLNSNFKGDMPRLLNDLNRGTGLNYFDEDKLKKLTVKCIYEIRCAIVHNKLGEYFLTNNDERFVVEIIEPLLQEVLKQSFSS